MQFKQSCLESHAFDALHVGNLPSSSQRTGCVREQLKKKVQEFIYAQSVVDASTQNVGGAQPFVEHMYVCMYNTLRRVGGDVLDGSMVDLAVPCLLASRWRWLRRFTMSATKGSFARCATVCS